MLLDATKAAAGPTLSTRWFYGFMRRWPALRVIRPRSLAINRAIATTSARITKYYEELNRILTKYDLKDKAQFIYNVDETGFNQEHAPLRVISGSKRSPSIVSCRSATTTLLACGSAQGTSLPPYLIFKGKNFSTELSEGSLPGSRFKMTDSGWSNGVVFRDFLSKHFIPSLPDRDPEQRVLLLYDGHKSHITVPLIEEARRNNIILFLLPPHTSHILQPLDVGCFGPMKAHFNRQCTDFPAGHPGRSITRYDLCGLISHSYLQSMRRGNLEGAFRKSGVCPFNPEAIDVIRMTRPSTVTNCEGHPAPRPSSTNVEALLASKAPSPPTKKTNKRKRRAAPEYEAGGVALTENGIFLTIFRSATAQTSVERPTRDHVNAQDNGNDEKCCQCNLDDPPTDSENANTNIMWAECESCQHWVHLGRCAGKEVADDDFFRCPCCLTEP